MKSEFSSFCRSWWVYTNSTSIFHQFSCLKFWEIDKLTQLEQFVSINSPIGNHNKAYTYRWDEQMHEYVEVTRPKVIHNKSMGVYLLDQTDCKIIHFLGLATVATWMEYRSDCVKVFLPTKHILDSMAYTLDGVDDRFLEAIKRHNCLVNHRFDNISVDSEKPKKNT